MSGRISVVLVCLIFSSWAVVKGVRAIYETGIEVSKELPRLPIDNLARTLLPRLTQGGGKILAHQVPQVATVEHVYLNMLKPYVQEAASLESFRSQLSSGEFAFAMTSMEAAISIIGSAITPKSQEDLYYAILERNIVDQGWHGYKRKEPIVVFSLREQKQLSRPKTGEPVFAPAITRINLLKLPQARFHYGWSLETWGNRARIIQGSGGGLFIPATLLDERTGGQASIHLSRNGGTTRPGLNVSVVVNSHVLSEVRNLPPKFSHVAFEIPPGILRRGDQNLVQFLLKYEDGTAIPVDAKTLLVASIAVTPPRAG